jgi:LuxR family maltose regulon positive regulatory protein
VTNSDNSIVFALAQGMFGLAGSPAVPKNGWMASRSKKPNTPPATPVAPSTWTGVVLDRERLYALIDTRLSGAIWLQGPTGAGKTVLLRAYLERRACPVAWLTIDHRHREPAGLFAAFAAAVAPYARGKLPTFSPEHRGEPTAFAADFFARLDALLDPGLAIAVDDAHHLADSGLPVLACAVDAFAGRRRFFVASQVLPGTAFALQLARARLWTIGHRLLAFDAREAMGLARRLGGDPLSLDDLVEATDGWAAGLMLAMQLGAAERPYDASNDPLESIRAPLALLIAEQVLGGVPAKDLARLRLFAELPQVPIDLATVAPDWSAACERLQALAERGLFIERHAATRRDRTHADASDASINRVARLPKGYWRLHDLLRSALREPTATGAIDAALAAELVAHLVGVERLDLAWQLASQVDGALLARVVDRHGSDALRSESLTSLLPLTAPHADRDDPSIALWMARGMIGNDDAAALRFCEEAFAGFVAQDDVARQPLAAALALFIVFASMEHAGDMAKWGERLAPFPATQIEAIAAEETRAIRVAGQVAYQLLVSEDETNPSANIARQDRLMDVVSAEVLSANETVLAGSLLVAALRRSLRVKDAELVIFRVDALASMREATPHLRARWNIENGFHFSRVGRFDEASRRFHAAIDIAESNALLQPRIDALIGLVRLAINLGDVDEAGRALALLEGFDPGRLGRLRGWVIHLRARIEALQGRHAKAIETLDLAERVLSDAGFPRLSRAVLGQDRVQFFYATGRTADSLALASAVAAASSPHDAVRVEGVRALLEAHACRHDDPDRAVRLLDARLGEAQARQEFAMLSLLPDVAADLVAFALQHELHVDFIRTVVRMRRLRAPLDSPVTWPWPVRVEVLHPFRIVVDGNALIFSGKAQQKPLELLKYLACARDLVAETSTIASALWPDADDQAARKSLEVTVSRLRKLLDDDTLVVVRDGKVALDARRLSSDARELSHACLEAEAVSSGRYAKARVDALGARLLTLFVALPLEEEESSAWREAVRERFRTAFVRAARTLITYWVDAGEAKRARALIEAAIAREPLAENLYRTLMQIHLDDGDTTEAMRVYRQCRQMLSVLIGAHPTADTERIKNSIHPS